MVLSQQVQAYWNSEGKLDYHGVVQAASHKLRDGFMAMAKTLE